MTLCTFICEQLPTAVGWEWGSWLLYGLCFLLFIAGILGCVLPYPGHLVILCSCALWTITRGEPYPGVGLWVALGLMALVGSFTDTIFSLLGAKHFGCSRAAIVCSFVGILVGLFFFPIGIIAGPFLGAFVGELLFTERSVGESAKSGVGALLGTLAGIAAKFVVAGLMITLYFW